MKGIYGTMSGSFVGTTSGQKKCSCFSLITAASVCVCVCVFLYCVDPNYGRRCYETHTQLTASNATRQSQWASVREAISRRDQCQTFWRCMLYGYPMADATRDA